MADRRATEVLEILSSLDPDAANQAVVRHLYPDSMTGTDDMRIFLDDERLPPANEPDWLVVRSVPALLEMVSAHSAEITEISFDNDLQEELEGRHAVGRIVGDALHPAMHLPRLERLTVHSANIVAAEAMIAMMHAAIRHEQIHAVEVRRRSALEFDYPIEAPSQ